MIIATSNAALMTPQPCTSTMVHGVACTTMEGGRGQIWGREHPSHGRRHHAERKGGEEDLIMVVVVDTTVVLVDLEGDKSTVASVMVGICHARCHL